jgi:amidase
MLIPALASSEPRSLLQLNIETISAGLQSEKFTSEELVKAYLERIKEAKDFNAVLQINPEALDLAKELDTEQRHHGRRRCV